ncbi:MAG: hypothetical protein JXQ75_00845 [Phycisphaerae bacterium]|nr:hypothetical protein [Phycisphaerae bacterium]
MDNDATPRRPQAAGPVRPGSRREPLRVVIHPVHGPDEGVDVTKALVEAIAMILWKLQGGNEPVNRLEAEMLLERVVRTRSDASDT